LQEALALAGDFATMVRNESKRSLTAWLPTAVQAVAGEMRGVAQGPRQDEGAVNTALTKRWNTGPLKEQVNRLKLLKCQMYGRASFQVLRALVLQAPGRYVAGHRAKFTRIAGEPQDGPRFSET
jgi:transposase